MPSTMPLPTIITGFLLLILIPGIFSACNNREKDTFIRSQSAYFKAAVKQDVPLGPPQEGEWLFTHQEKGQTFEAYKAAHPVKPTAAQAVIYLLPVGEFTPLQLEILQAVTAYNTSFFQLSTILLPSLPDTGVPASAMRQQTDGNIQLLAPYLLDSLLRGKLPDDGIALLAISAKDLYPKNNWNYVFGLASYVNRVGISSIYRLQNKQLDTSSYQLCLSRLMKITTHEIGHMFTLHHCISARCVMNGTNSLAETDRTPIRLCTTCQKKLCWNFQFDSKKRLEQLIHFCRQHNLEAERMLLQADTQ